MYLKNLKISSFSVMRVSKSTRIRIIFGRIRILTILSKIENLKIFLCENEIFHQNKNIVLFYVGGVCSAALCRGGLFKKKCNFQTVESPEFVELVRYLNPTKSTFSRRELGRKIVDRNKKMVDHLIRLVIF